MTAITSITGIGPGTAEILAQHGFTSVTDIARASVGQLQSVPGFGAIRASRIIDAAVALLKEAVPSSKKIMKQKKKEGKEKKQKKKSLPVKEKKKKKKKGVKESKGNKKKGKKKAVKKKKKK